MNENTKELTIPCSEIPGLEKHKDRNVVIRKLNYGDKADITDEILQITANNQRIRLGHLRLYALVYGVKEAPFFDGETGTNTVHWHEGLKPNQVVSRAYIVRNLDEQTGSALLQHVLEANPNLLQGVGGEKKE